MFRVLICGSRDWTDESMIESVLMDMALEFGRLTVVHGAAPGADMCADRAARRLKMYVEPHPADWKRHGRAAGPIRNAEMLDAPGGIHYLHCFKDNFDNLLRKGGSENMVKQAMSRRISVKLHNHG